MYWIKYKARKLKIIKWVKSEKNEIRIVHKRIAKKEEIQGTVFFTAF